MDDAEHREVQVGGRWVRVNTTELDISAEYVNPASRPRLLSDLVARSHEIFKNRLVVLPDSIGQLVNLTKLDMRHNMLENLPDSIGNLGRLTELEMSNNRLRELPDTIGQLGALTELSVGDNQLTALPPFIGQLGALTSLYVSNNRLTALPPSIGQLGALTMLDVSDNQLTALPPSIGVLPDSIGQLVNLTKLDMSNNLLENLPDSIGNLGRLTELEMSNNRLRELPDTIGQLGALTELSVGDNQLTALPPSIGQLGALTSLYVSNNRLTALPPSIGQLGALTMLDVSDNQLTELPPSIGQLGALTSLYVNDNPLQLPPLATAEQGPDAVRRFFRDLAEGATTSRACKLLLTGHACAGKSSLLHGWMPRPAGHGVQAKASCAPLDPPITADARTINVERHTLAVGAGSARVDFSCWDFGGQSEYGAIQQVYLTPLALVVLVVSAKHVRSILLLLRQARGATGPEAEQARRLASQREEEVLGRWLRFLRLRVPNAVVQPVLTFCDGARGDAADEHAWLGERLSAQTSDLRIQSPIQRVSSIGGGDASLRAALAQIEHLSTIKLPAPLLPTIGQPIPRSWLAAFGLLRALRDGLHPVALVQWELRRAEAANAPASLAGSKRTRAAADTSTAPAQPGERPTTAAAASLRCERLDDVLDRHWSTLVRSPALAAEWPTFFEALAEPQYRKVMLNDALTQLVGEGELFVAGGIVYLDIQLVTDVLSPLVDHRLNDQAHVEAMPILHHVLSNAQPPPSTPEQYLALQSDVYRLHDGLRALLPPRCELRADVLPFLWRTAAPTHQTEHIETLCTVGVLFPLRPRTWILPARLPERCPDSFEQHWLSNARHGEVRLSAIAKWTRELPEGLAERAIVAMARHDTSAGCCCLWRRGVVLQRIDLGVQSLVCVRREGDEVLLELAVRGPVADEASLDSLRRQLRARMQAILTDYSGLHVVWSETEERPEMQPERRLSNLTAAVMSNTKIDAGEYAGTEHISARKLVGVLQSFGARTVHWIDTEASGDGCADPLLPRLKAQLDQPCDGFIFVYDGHGDAGHICGAAPVKHPGPTHTVTQYKQVVRTICEHPNMQDKPKLILFDCCREGNSVQMLDIQSDTLVAFSTRMGTGSWINPGLGCLFTDKLADTLAAKGHTHDVQAILMEVRRELTQAATAGPSAAPAGVGDVAYNQAPPVIDNLRERIRLV